MPDIDDVLHRLDRIQDLMGQLAKARGDFVEQQDIADRLRLAAIRADAALELGRWRRDGSDGVVLAAVVPFVGRDAVADATTREETAGLKPGVALGHSVGATATARKNIAMRIALFVLRCYKIYLSMLFAGTCRFEPTCSQYAYEAIERFGVLHGVWLGSKRLARCHPFSGKFGSDPVPKKLSNNHICGGA